VIFLRPRLALLLLASLTLAACSHEGSAKTPDPASLLQAIPGADSAKYEHMQDMRNWRNPYFIVRADTIVLLDAADNAEIHLKPEEVLPALAQLPAANWPYGRVVAVAENSARGSEQDGTAIRRNKGVLGGVLAGAHIDVRWVPVT
jgi:hypothetical protein